MAMKSRKPKASHSLFFKALFVGIACAIMCATNSEAAFTPKTSVFSASKPDPLGFSQLVEPNVLLLIDTSSSMTERMDSSTFTYGDGTKPCRIGNTTYIYYGKDNNPGENTTDNNDPSVDYNYHPLLRYIPDSEILSNDNSYTSYFSYNREQNTGRRWVEGYWYRGRWIPAHWEEYTYYTYAYKYPNDSRTYVLKNVLYRILGDTTLVGNLRLALASYYQTYYPSGYEGSWWNNYNFYQWFPENFGSRQRLTWAGDATTRSALLWKNFASTTNETGHLDAIRQYFDGTETSVNPEFRSCGSTPLASSIYNGDSKRKSAGHFFSANGVITDWCQDNWLIVFTDGEDWFNEDAAAAVNSLYHLSITVEGKPAKKIKTMVIGLIDPDTQTALRNVLNNMADYGDDGILNQSKTAYFPRNMEQLMAAFREIFKTIQDFAATSSAPLVNPPRSEGDVGKVYSTGFKPKNDQQWTGYLYSYTISGDVMMTPYDWEAGGLLNARAASSRNIYTADWNNRTSTKLSGSNVKLFQSGSSGADAEQLRPLVADAVSSADLSDTKFAQFIDWVRGENVWNEGTRWKLGDPYHVGLAAVGAPRSLLTDADYKTFKTSHSARTPIVYMHANDGMVHALNAETGFEEWAFIPPNVLDFRRLLGTKINTSNVWVANDATSTPRFLLDGPLIAEDALIGGSYKTVLLGCLGRAGAGLYALDVTDPAKPQFLWAAENNYYDDRTMAVRPSNEQTYIHWQGNPAAFPTSSVLTTSSSSNANVPGKLRLTVSTPFVGNVVLESGVKWITLFGAGAQYSPGNTQDESDGGGKAVYILNLADGSRLREMTDPSLGMAIAPLTVESGPAALRMRFFYAGDDNGAVFEGDTSNLDPATWSLVRVFTPGKVNDIDIVLGIPYAVEIGSIKNQKWLFWGTGDPDGLFGGQTGQSYIVAFNRSNFGDTGATFADLESLTMDTASKATASNGWYLPLDAKEVVTTPTVLYRGYLFIATYTPSNDNCEVGDSNLYILEADTGLGGWTAENSVKRITLDATRISGITISGGKVYAGVTRYPGASALPSGLGGATLSGNLLVLDVPSHIQDNNSQIDSKSAKPAYWREWKP